MHLDFNRSIVLHLLLDRQYTLYGEVEETILAVRGATMLIY